MAVLSQVRTLLILSLVGLWALAIAVPNHAVAQAVLKGNEDPKTSQLDGCHIQTGLNPRTTPVMSFLKMGEKKDGAEYYLLRTKHPENPLVEARAFHDKAPGERGRMLYSNVSMGRRPALIHTLHGDDQPCNDPARGCRPEDPTLQPLTQKGEEPACWRAEGVMYASYTANENSAQPHTPGLPLRAYGDANRICKQINMKKPPPDSRANPLGDGTADNTNRPRANGPDARYGGTNPVVPESAPAAAAMYEDAVFKGKGIEPWKGEVNNQPPSVPEKEFDIALVSDAQAAGGAQQFISIIMRMLQPLIANSFQSAGKTGFEDVGMRALSGLPMVSMFSSFLSPQNFQGNFPAILANRIGRGGMKYSLGFESILKHVGAVVVTPAYAVYDPNDFRPGQEIQLAEKVAEKTVEEWAAAKSFGLSVTNEALAAPGDAGGADLSLLERYKRTTEPDVFKAIFKDMGGYYIKNLTNTGTFNPLLSGWENFSGINVGGNLQDMLGRLVGQLSGVLQNALKAEMGKQKMSQQNQDVQKQFWDGILQMNVNELSMDAQQLIPVNLRGKKVSELPANLQQALKEHYTNKQISHNGENEQRLLDMIIGQMNVGGLLGGGGGGGNAAQAALQNALQNALKPLSQRLTGLNFQDLFKTKHMQIMRGDHPYAPMQTALFQDRKFFSPCTSGDCYATRNFKMYSDKAGPARVWPAYYPTGVEGGMNSVRFAGTLDSRATGNDPIGMMIPPHLYDLVNSLMMQRIHYNRWCHADPLGCCIGCSCPPKPCPPEIPCWSQMCWGVPISFETPPAAVRHDAPHDIAWQLKDPGCVQLDVPSSCRYTHHPRLKTKKPNPADLPLGFWAVANKADLELKYPIFHENVNNIWEIARKVTTPLPIAQKLALCDTKVADQNRQFVASGTSWFEYFGNDGPAPRDPETMRAAFQPGAGPPNRYSQRFAETFVCTNKNTGGDVQVAANDADKPHLNLAAEIKTEQQLGLLINSAIAAAQAPAGNPSSQCSYGGVGGQTGGCKGQTGTGPQEGQFGELLMHQMNAFRHFGHRCMPNYERAFMPWDQSGFLAHTLGADVNPVSTDRAPHAGAGGGGGERNLTRLVRMTARCPGHLTEANPGSLSSPFKHVAKWENGLGGIAKIKRASASGAVIHGPRGFDKKPDTVLMPDLAIVVRAGKDDTGDFIDVVRTNGGRFPDACGVTNELGMTHPQRWRQGGISQYAQKDNQEKQRRAGDSCSDTSAYECSIGAQWASLQWFDALDCQNRNDASCQQAANEQPDKNAVAEAK